jgi:heptosyltransferase-2
MNWGGESRAICKYLLMIEARPLIVRLRNFVGDTVLSIPALRLLESHGYALQLLGKGWARGLLEAEGWPVHVRAADLHDRIGQLRVMRRDARQLDPQFDKRANMLLFPYAFSAALDARFAGLKPAGHAGDGRSWLLKRALPRRDGRHTLVEYWELACDFLGVQAEPPKDIGMQVSDGQREAARALLATHGLEPGRYVLICPFANGRVEFLDRSWPAFPDFVRQAKAAGHRVVIVPGPAEVQGARDLYPDALPLDGVPLGVYNALLQLAGVVVANDTGPAHMAAGVGARLLSIWGPVDAARWAPWGSTVTLMRRGPGAWSGVDEVMSAVDQALP